MHIYERSGFTFVVHWLR